MQPPAVSPFLWPVRVYYEDTDAGGVVYYANYLKFFERARTEMLRDRGYEQDQLRDNDGIIFAVRSVQVDYLRPARFNEQLQVSAEISLDKPVNLTFRQAITRAHELLCQGTIRIACLDANTLRPKIIPDNLLQQLKNGY